MRKKTDNKLIFFTAILFIALFFSLAFDSYGQGSALVRSCAGTGLTVKQAKLEVTKDGDINIIPCDSRSVLLRGNVLEGSGTVQSVGLTLPNIFTVTGSPITASGTIAATLASQTANYVWASPNGSSGAPTFRALVAADIPSLDAAKITTGTFSTSAIPSLAASKITSGTFDTALIPSLDAAKITTGTFSTSQIPSLAASKITSGTIDTARLGSGTASGSTFLRGDNSWQTISTGIVTFEYAVGATRTLTNADAGIYIGLNNGTIILPASATDGMIIRVMTYGGTNHLQFLDTGYLIQGSGLTNYDTSTNLTVSGSLTLVRSTGYGWVVFNGNATIS